MAAPLEPTATPGIYRRGSRYVFRFRDPQGRVRQRSARTIAEAKRMRSALGADVHRGEFRELSRVTLGEYAETWARTYQGRTGRGVRPETLADYRRDLQMHVAPFFGPRTLLTSIEPRRVKEFALSLSDSGWPRIRSASSSPRCEPCWRQPWKRAYQNEPRHGPTAGRRRTSHSTQGARSGRTGAANRRDARRTAEAARAIHGVDGVARRRAHSAYLG